MRDHFLTLCLCTLPDCRKRISSARLGYYLGDPADSAAIPVTYCFLGNLLVYYEYYRFSVAGAAAKKGTGGRVHNLHARTALRSNRKVRCNSSNRGILRAEIGRFGAEVWDSAAHMARRPGFGYLGTLAGGLLPDSPRPPTLIVIRR